MINIRPYVTADYLTIKDWWLQSGEIAPLRSMMPEDSSFIATYENFPILAVSLYLTNSTEVCWADNLIGIPFFGKGIRREATQLMQKHIEKVAKELGYARIFCFTNKPRLAAYYADLGYSPTLTGVITFSKKVA